MMFLTDCLSSHAKRLGAHYAFPSHSPVVLASIGLICLSNVASAAPDPAKRRLCPESHRYTARRSRATVAGKDQTVQNRGFAVTTRRHVPVAGVRMHAKLLVRLRARAACRAASGPAVLQTIGAAATIEGPRTCASIRTSSRGHRGRPSSWPTVLVALASSLS